MPTAFVRGVTLWRATLLALLAWLIVTPATAQTFPKFTGLVVDAANVLPPEQEAALTTKLEALQKQTHRQLVVATIPDLQGYPIADYGYRLGRTWGVGLRDVNNGAILIVAPNGAAGQRGVRIEVGRGMEPIITDALSSVLINQTMIPKLRAGDIPGAVSAGVDEITRQMQASPEEAQARLDTAAKQFDATHRRSGTSQSGGVPFGVIIWGIILLFVLLPLLRGRKRAGPWGQRYNHDGGSALPIVLWGLANEIGRSSQGGGWSGGGGGSGGGSDGSWGGGGFTGGGGGDFGGGGASGSW